MNVIQVVKPAVAGFAASEGGKLVISTGKKICKSALRGIGFGGAIGGFVAGIKIGYKASSKAVPQCLKPVTEILDQITKDAPEFTVTFHKKETVEGTEADNNVPEKPEE